MRYLLNILRILVRLVSLKGVVRGPTWSPDFKSFFPLRDYAKVFKPCPHTPEQLRERFIEEVNIIPFDMYQRAAENFGGRLQQCVAA